MTAGELILQSGIFAIVNLVLLILLSVALHFSIGRVLLAILVSLIFLIAECFALFKVTRSLWRVSSRVAFAILKTVHPGQPSALLTERNN